MIFMESALGLILQYYNTSQCLKMQPLQRRGALRGGRRMKKVVFESNEGLTFKDFSLY